VIFTLDCCLFSLLFSILYFVDPGLPYLSCQPGLNLYLSSHTVIESPIYVEYISIFCKFVFNKHVADFVEYFSTMNLSHLFVSAQIMTFVTTYKNYAYIFLLSIREYQGFNSNQHIFL
jgi:hypothetical protein